MMNIDFNLPPQEALDYLRNKGFLLTFDHQELQTEAHHKAFSVAKVTRADLLLDIFNALVEAQEIGKPFSAFQKELKPALAKQGWLGTTTVEDPKTGRKKTIEVGAKRLKTIFHTNMRVSYNVGRYQQMRKLTKSLYWFYSSLRLPTTRSTHRAAHGTLKHRDDPWWQINYPPNGWGCKCKVRAYSKKQLEKKGLKLTQGKLPDLAKGDWAYDVGAGSRVGKLENLDLDASLSNMPAFYKDQSLKNLNEQQLSSYFFQQMNLKPGDPFIDKIGDPMTIDGQLFWDRQSNQSKIKKHNRHLFLPEIIKTLKDPDEVFLEFDDKHFPKGTLVKRMFRYVKTANGAKRAILIVFRYSPQKKTQGVTAHFVGGAGATESRRTGKLVYQKGH